jgi:ABC-type transport system involved in cytochrome c biogenesis permease subunit
VIVETIFIILALVGYLLALMDHVLRGEGRLYYYILVIGVFMHLAALITRSYIAHHPPFSNLYETMILLPFVLSIRLLIWKRQIPESYRPVVLGMGAVLLIIAVFMSPELKEPHPLMPALNSFWMYIHVPVYFLGYMAVAIAFLYSCIIMVKQRKLPAEKSGTLERRLDHEVKIAFFFLNIGLVTGAVWAYVSWGSYWGWDPKETWALVNVLILSFYFHHGKKTIERKTFIVVLTFISVIFTYWGVSYILAGLHSYV